MMDYLLSEAQLSMQQNVKKLAEEHFKEKAVKWDQTGEYPWENVEKLVEHELMGFTIPEEYGGKGGGVLEVVLAVEQIARVCASTARLVVDSNTGPVKMLLDYGNEEIKKKAANLIINGEKPAVCITELEAGSAATDMETTAILDGDEYVINGDKTWITGGGVSQIYIVFSKVNKGQGIEGIGAFFIEKDTPGFTIGKRVPTMGLRGTPESELHFRNCRIPKENLLTIGIGKLMNAYNSQRLGATAVSLGLAQGAYELAIDFAKERHQFGKPIGANQGIQWMVADMAMELEAGRLLTYRAAVNAGKGLPNQHETAKAKAYVSDMSVRVTNASLQMFGSRGCSKEYPLERMVRDARMFKIAGGTTEMLKTLIGENEIGIKINKRQ